MNNNLILKDLGIDTYKQAIIFIRKDCDVCRSEGFEVHARIKVMLNDKSIIATLNIIDDGILSNNEASLSKYAWGLLNANVGDVISLSHPKPMQSLSYVRSKVYGSNLNYKQINSIIEDISSGNYSDIHIATFLTACANDRLNNQEIVDLTKSMINAGGQLSWDNNIIVDKHCVGGLPGNRTTPIIVPIVTEFGLTMPKTSSRSITSPAGTADTMEVLTSVDIDLRSMQKVVQQEGGCIVWGGSVDLSPADDILIRVERVMNLDCEGQLIASVLSKKISAGSTHIVIDIPIGPTAKVRTIKTAERLVELFEYTGKILGVNLNIILSDGLQPIGRGIGPALEAQDVIDVLQNNLNQPVDLKNRALEISGKIIEFSSDIKKGEGLFIAKEILESGRAWKKFQAICEAQGGIKEIKKAKFMYDILADKKGKITNIDNRLLSRLAKLAGAPHDKEAGIYMHCSLDNIVEKQQPVYTIHANSKGELKYALSLLDQIPDIIQIEPCD